MSENFAGPYHAESIVAYFVAKNNDILEPMRANKLAYIAYAWTLVILNRKLFYDTIETWSHGPIVASLIHKMMYHDIKVWPLYYRMLDQLDGQTKAVLDRVWQSYGKYNKYQLSGMCNDKDSLWKSIVGNTKHKDIIRNIIPDNLIKEHYERLSKERAVVDLVNAP